MDREDLKAIEDGKLIDTLKDESLNEEIVAHAVDRDGDEYNIRKEFDGTYSIVNKETGAVESEGFKTIDDAVSEAKSMSISDESLNESVDTDWRLIYSGTDDEHNYGDKVTELHKWDKDRIFDHLVDGGSQFSLNDGTEVEIEFDDGEWDEVWPQILRQFKNGKLEGKLVISESLTEDTNRGDYIECPICHQDYYEDEMTNTSGYGLVCNDCFYSLKDKSLNENKDKIIKINGKEYKIIKDGSHYKAYDSKNKLVSDSTSLAQVKKEIKEVDSFFGAFDESLNEAYDETLEDHICRRLREEDVNFDYDYDITWTFDTIDDYNRGDEIICNIVGDGYEGDRNSLSIDVWALVDDGESFNEDTTFEESLVEGTSGYNWDTTRLQDLVYYYMSDDDFIEENKLKNLLKKQLATEGTPVGENSKELKIFNDKVMSILDNYYEEVDDYEDIDDNYFDESLNEGRPYKPLYNKIIELLKEKDVDYVLENTKTGARFVQGNNDKATCISFVSEGANDDESITVRCYYKDNKGHLTNNIIIAREKDFDKIKNALFSNPSYEGTPVNINLR